MRLPLLLLLALPAAVQAQFNYITSNGTITITGYTGPGDVVDIPSLIDGLPVTSIGNEAFLEESTLTSITIPDSVANIGDAAFKGCRGLTSITIGDGVISIGEQAFNYCISLTSVTIPSSVTSIQGYAFYNCYSLTNVTIGNGVTSIGIFAFFSCNLTSITIPSGVTSIVSSAFSYCTRLTNVTIGSGVTSIGVYTFFDCTSLTAITADAENSIYGSVDGVLFNKNGTTLVQFPPGKTGNYTIPIGVTSIGDYSFSYCPSLTGITIPSSVTNIGNSAFSFCASLTSVTIPAGVTRIGDFAFYGCMSLTAIAVAAGNSTYDSVDGVLFNKSQTTLIQCPARKTGSYTIPSSVTSLGERAFYYCASLTNITIPDSVTSIGDRMFHYCYSLISVTIGSGVTNIGNEAFSECSSLASVTIPGSVTHIGNNAFYDCYSLNGIYFQGDAPNVGLSVWIGFTATVYYLPETTGWGPTFGNRPTAPWVLPNPLILSNGSRFGVHTNQFGFIISWATNHSVVVEACTDLSQPIWSPVGTNTLTDGSSYFSDPQWTNYPRRFYRLRSP